MYLIGVDVPLLSLATGTRRQTIFSSKYHLSARVAVVPVYPPPPNRAPVFSSNIRRSVHVNRPVREVRHRARTWPIGARFQNYLIHADRMDHSFPRWSPLGSHLSEGRPRSAVFVPSYFCRYFRRLFRRIFPPFISVVISAVIFCWIFCRIFFWIFRRIFLLDFPPYFSVGFSSVFFCWIFRRIFLLDFCIINLLCLSNFMLLLYFPCTSEEVLVYCVVCFFLLSKFHASAVLSMYCRRNVSFVCCFLLSACSSSMCKFLPYSLKKSLRL